MSDFNLFVDWCIDSFKSIYIGLGNWGYVGAFILAMPVLRRLIRLLKTIFS